MDPAGQLRSAESSIGPNLLDSMIAKNRTKNLLGPTAFDDIGRSSCHTHRPTQCIDANGAFVSVSLLGRIVAHWPTVRVGTDALAMHGPRTGLFAFAVYTPQQLVRTRIYALQQTRQRPASKVAPNVFPIRKIFWKYTAGTATFENIDKGVEHSAQARAGTPSSSVSWM